MSHASRIRCPGVWYHGTCRGNDRRDTSADGVGRAVYAVEVRGCVMMRNGFYLLVSTLQGNLSGCNISDTSACTRRPDSRYVKIQI